MPMYQFKCLSCGNIQDILLGISEIADRDSDEVELSDLGVSCDKCQKTTFCKMISAHSKTSHNWSKWQRNEH